MGYQPTKNPLAVVEPLSTTTVLLTAGMVGIMTIVLILFLIASAHQRTGTKCSEDPGHPEHSHRPHKHFH